MRCVVPFKPILCVMRKIAVLAVGLVIVLTACQKEADLNDPNGTTGGSGTGTAAGVKLVRIGTRTGADSITTDFAYNAAVVLSNIHYAGTVNRQAIDAHIRIVRNASNLITTYVATSNIYAAVGLDSLVTSYVYDAAAGRYKYGLARYSYLGVSMADSTVFTYDASGRLVSGVSYSDDGSGRGYRLDSKTDYAYSGSNIATEKSYSYNGTSYDLDESVSYDVYDAKANPLFFPNDAPVLGMATFYSASNPLKRTTTDNTGLSPVTSIANFTYTYNGSNFPVKAVSTDGTNTSASTYYYQ